MNKYKYTGQSQQKYVGKLDKTDSSDFYYVFVSVFFVCFFIPTVFMFLLTLIIHIVLSFVNVVEYDFLLDNDVVGFLAEKIYYYSSQRFVSYPLSLVLVFAFIIAAVFSLSNGASVINNLKTVLGKRIYGVYIIFFCLFSAFVAICYAVYSPLTDEQLLNVNKEINKYIERDFITLSDENKDNVLSCLKTDKTIENETKSLMDLYLLRRYDFCKNKAQKVTDEIRVKNEISKTQKQREENLIMNLNHINDL